MKRYAFRKVFSLAALLFIAVAARAEEHQVCTGTGPPVAILVDPSLVGGIHLGLEQFEIDLCNEGYAVIEKRSNFTTPPEVRAYLAELYARTQQRLIGAILIGNLPHA